MRSIAITAGIVLLAITAAHTQVVKTNEKGEKIIEYPDGTWKPFIENGSGDTLGLPADQDPYRQPDPEELARRKAIRIAELLSADAAQLESFAEESRTHRLQLEAQLEDMKTSDQFSSREIQEMERKVRQEKEREDLAYSLYNQAIRLAQDAENLIFLKPKKMEKSLARLEADKTALSERMLLLSTIKQPATVAGVPNLGDRIYRDYDPAQNTQVNPPALPCNFTHNEVDKFTGKLRRDLEPVLLFTHTPKDLRPFLRDREYITCWGYLADLSEGLLFLSLEFVIASNNAPAAFGGIPNGSILSVLTLDGESIRLINYKTDAGFFDERRGVYIYRAQFQIGGLVERVLQSKEVDQMRVIWATGYEDYEVFELDFFRNQINCLRNTN